MATDTEPVRRNGSGNGQNLPAISQERLPYHPAIQERFGIDRSGWRALVEAVFPNATTTDSVVLALSYCKARSLDPFKRNVHIVPIWDKDRRCMVDTIWPGIGEIRTTAIRTGQYAGRDKTEFGPDVEMKVGNVQMTFPEWAQVTVYRLVNGVRVAFAGPQVYWLETYSQMKRDDASPNSMWQKRPRGQIDKCAEAAALRAAFPEEVGNELINDEISSERPSVVRQDSHRRLEVDNSQASDALADRLEGVPTTTADSSPAPATPEDEFLQRIEQASTIEEYNAIGNDISEATKSGELTGAEGSRLKKHLMDKADS